MLGLRIAINPYPIVKTSTLIIVDNEVRCLSCLRLIVRKNISILCSLLLAEGTETRGLSLKMLFLGWLHKVSQREVCQTIDYWVELHYLASL